MKLQINRERIERLRRAIEAEAAHDRMYATVWRREGARSYQVEVLRSDQSENGECNEH